MHVQRLLGAIVVAVVTAVAYPTVMTADEAGTPRKLKALNAFVTSPGKALGCALAAEANGNAAVCYGFVKVAGKPRYTYFLLYKVDPAKIETHSHLEHSFRLRTGPAQHTNRTSRSAGILPAGSGDLACSGAVWPPTPPFSGIPQVEQTSDNLVHGQL